MVAELAIRQVVAEYCHLVDDGRLVDLVQLFTDDGTFSFGRLSAYGRAEVRSWFEQYQPPELRGKHLTTNTVVQVKGDRATAVSDFAFLVFQEGQLVSQIAGRYHDEFRQVDRRWLIQSREAVALRPPR